MHQSLSLSIPLSLYIHIPWCVKKCPYCDFNSHQNIGEIPEKAYIDTLTRDLCQDLSLAQHRNIQSIFFGGGTPSLFSPQGIDNILNNIARHLAFSDKIEITLEANPGTVEHKSFADYRAAGINRVSLGVQSFQDEKLLQLGRIHKAVETEKAIRNIIAAKFNSFNIDLMYGLPNQSIADALYDLNTALTFSPPHLSWYNLTIEPNTLFAHQKPILPADDMIADIEMAGKPILEKHGLNQYEVSAFSIPHFNCVHNLNYWQFGDYLGIGAGAHSKITDLNTGVITRYTKTRTPKSYLSENHPLRAETKIISKTEIPFEFMLNALRLNQGVSISLFEQRTGASISSIQKPLEMAIHQNLLVIDNNTLTPTQHGRLFLNNLLQLFLID